ncbi:MAG: DNA repair protein RecO [Candidatus Euphemobacter frigidus]|nr:DNA repair protein RecO [Candidatus Euphemobacter frigidus]MDP8274938.1 DNA repair protein RecO [Candidatus Euphemobacter frigidus]
MPPQKIRGIILQSRDYTETSKLVNFLTPEQGLLKTLAKGARRSTSPLRGKLELLNYGTLVFYPSRSSDLHLLAQFDLLIPFPEALNTLEKSAFFHYLAELASSAAYGGEHSRDLFELLFHTLRNASKIHAFFQGRLWFEIRYLHLLGVLPPLDRCSKCRRSLKFGARFSLRKSNWFCPDCGGSGDDMLSIEPGLLAAISYISRSSLEQVVKLKLSSRQSAVLGRLLRYLIDSSVDKKIKSRRFLDQVIPD